MEPSLDEKIAFFERLKSLQRDCDGDEDLGADEEEHRARCRGFARSLRKPRLPQSRSNLQAVRSSPGAPHRRIASDPITSAGPRSDVEVIVIEDTPRVKKGERSKSKVPALPRAASLAEDVTIIPSSIARASTQSGRKVTFPPSRRSSRSSPPAEDSFAASMPGKRKRPSKLKMVPVEQQCFRDLSFFYIPNEDVDPVRERRISRAKEHGANWVRNINEATHVIVDRHLKFGDIEKILREDSSYTDKIIVNDGYPIDCIAYRKLVKPDQDKYEVVGLPKPAEVPADIAASSQVSIESLQLKPKPNQRRRKGYIDPNATPPRGGEFAEQSTELSPGQVISSTQEKPIVPISISSGDSQSQRESRLLLSQSSSRVADNIACAAVDDVADELSQWINFAKSNPEAGIQDEDDDQMELTSPTSPPAEAETMYSPTNEADFGESNASEERHPRKRKRTSRKDPKATQIDSSWQEKFACMKGGTMDAEPGNPNAQTIAILQEMCDHYTNNDDTWRIKAYRQAISSLRQQSIKITTSEQAREIAGIGDRLADKIEEIVNTGELQRLKHAREEPNAESRALFLKIYGVGIQQANKWIGQGFRTLADLRERASLNKNQQVGLEHYDDLNTRIPRAEVEALGKYVKRAAADLDPRVELLIGGSYRRGADSSGDIDLIVTKKGTTSSADLAPFLAKLIAKLSDAGFLTAGLAVHWSNDGLGSKWHGCCVLPRDDFPGDAGEYRPTWRRIDFLLVPEAEFGAALIYFTGNDLFNRSMRLLASKKGMRLNQRGLYKDVMRGPGRVKVTEGELVEGRDEKKIFAALGVHWREPHQRWC
ncbi:hypothetical protein BX600DRAFT_453097 [Xylariales sp. PMI_506]|nr:hypothetical protein BX600DRAFT_453097 [Xylariales sp. PMI_506]